MSRNDSAGSVAAQTLVKPLIVGGIAAAAGYILLPGYGIDVKLIGQTIPNYLAAGVAGAAGSLASDILSQYILPNLPQDDKLSYTEGRLLSPIITGASTAAAFWIMNYNALSEAGGKIALIGAGSEIAGMYAWESVIGPYLNREQV